MQSLQLQGFNNGFLIGWVDFSRRVEHGRAVFRYLFHSWCCRRLQLKRERGFALPPCYFTATGQVFHTAALSSYIKQLRVDRVAYICSLFLMFLTKYHETTYKFVFFEEQGCDVREGESNTQSKWHYQAIKKKTTLIYGMQPSVNPCSFGQFSLNGYRCILNTPPVAFI